MKLEYRIEERWPEGVQFTEDGAGCSLNVGKLPACVVVGAAALLLGVAVLYGVAGIRVAWGDWRRGNGVDVGFMLWVGAAMLLFGGCGARILRRHMRFGHLPGVYRLDEMRRVFGFREAGTLRWREWDAGRIREVRVREVRLPVGSVVWVLLTIRMAGRRFALAALFGRKQRDGVQAFALRVREYAVNAGPVSRGDGPSDEEERFP